MKANQRVPQNKYEGALDRNFTTYNPQVVRDDVFLLGIDGTVKKNRMAVIRSSSAVVVGSQNANREWVYSQQQTVSARGLQRARLSIRISRTPRAARGTTKSCTDCHLSKANDNNAWMTSAARLRHGHGEFLRPLRLGRRRRAICTASSGRRRRSRRRRSAARSTRSRIRGTSQEHVARTAAKLQDGAIEHHAKEINDLTLRGEYLYTANGPAGFEVFDVANIDQKGFQRAHRQRAGFAARASGPMCARSSPRRSRCRARC